MQHNLFYVKLDTPKKLVQHWVERTEKIEHGIRYWWSGLRKRQLGANQTEQIIMEGLPEVGGTTGLVMPFGRGAVACGICVARAAIGFI